MQEGGIPIGQLDQRYVPYTGALYDVDLNGKHLVNIDHLGVGTSVPPDIIGRFIGNNNNLSRITMRGYSNNAASSSIRVAKYRGTYSSPLKAQSGDSMGSFEFGAFSGNNGANSNVGGYIEGVTTEAWDTGTQGSKMNFYTTPNGTISSAIALTLDQDKTSIFAGNIQLSGNTLYGNSTSGGNLTLQSTSHTTKGKILFGTSVYDEVNNYLGIGTNSPQRKLDIQTPGGVNVQMRLGDTVGDYYDIGRNDSTGFLNFTGNQTGYIGYTFNGKVGIGTTSPGAKLEVDAATATDIGVIFKTTDDSATKSVWELQNSGGSWKAKFTNTGALGIGGLTPSGDTMTRLHRTTASTSAATIVYYSSYLTHTTTDSSDKNVFTSQIYSQGTANANGTISALFGDFHFNQASPYVTAKGVGIMSQIFHVNTGVLTAGYGWLAKAPSFSSTGTIGTLYGGYIENQGNALITNSYGLYIAAQSGSATLNYSIYTNAGLVHHGDVVDAPNYSSTVVTGTQPYACTSTTLNTNLNADMVDGKHVGTSGNTIPLLDGSNTWSGLNIFASGGGLPYGSMYGDDISLTVTVSASATYYPVPTGLTTGSVNQFTFANSTLTCLVAGKYKVDWGMTLQCATANQEVTGAVMINTTAQMNTEGATKLTTANDNKCVAGSGIITLAVNDVVKLSIENETATNDITVTHATLALVMIGS